MAISFNEIPRTIRVPFVYVEMDNSNAVNGAAQAKTLFGEGSMLAQACAKYLEGDSMTEMWAMAVEDAASGNKATGTVTLSGAATESGTLALYIGGRAIKVAVALGAQAAAVATALAAAIEASADCPCSAAAEGAVITLTAKHKGEAGNGIDVRLNYYAESTPAGLSAAIVAMHGGSGNPDVATLIAAMGDEHYNVICWPWTDTSSLVALEAELADRWGPLRMIEAMAVSAATGTHGALGTLGDGRNSPHLCIMHAHGSPTPTWEMAAAVAAIVAYYGNIDPARPFQTLPLKGVLPPAKADLFTLQENNLLLFDGISTFTVDAGGTVRAQRLITTYKTSPAGAEDVSYLDVCTPLTLGYLRYDFRNYILRKYPRHKLADDGTNYGPGQAVITPKVGKAEAIARARVWENLGLVENVDTFAEAVICERNDSDRNRLDWYLPPDLVNQFVVGAAQIGFIL